METISTAPTPLNLPAEFLAHRKAADDYRLGCQAWDLLSTASPDSDDPAQLVHALSAASLLITCRDDAALYCLEQTPLWGKLLELKPLKQQPSLLQLLALLNSVQAQILTPEDKIHIWPVLQSQLDSLSDKALGIETVKVFRDCLMIQGLPEWTDRPGADCTKPNSINRPRLSWHQLHSELLQGWPRFVSIVNSWEAPPKRTQSQ